MDCKEFEKKIPAFISRDLAYKELKQFLEHMEHCPECREELTIQILISEGMIRLEEGNAFDLQKEIDGRLREAERQIRMHKTMRYVRITLELAALAAFFAVIVLFVL